MLRKRLKARLVWPRLGYVAPRTPPLPYFIAGADEADFLNLQRGTELTKGNLSGHLSKLEAAGYLALRKNYRGKIPMTLRRLTPHGRASFMRCRTALTQLADAVPMAPAAPARGSQANRGNGSAATEAV